MVSESIIISQMNPADAKTQVKRVECRRCMKNKRMKRALRDAMARANAVFQPTPRL
jgi:hypothetical protein